MRTTLILLSLLGCYQPPDEQDLSVADGLTYYGNYFDNVVARYYIDVPVGLTLDKRCKITLENCDDEVCYYDIECQ